MPFAPGQSGNPGGRPAGYAEFRDACRARTPEALASLVAALSDPERSVSASQVILSYAWGRPPQALTGEGGEGPVKITVEIVDGGATEAPP